MNKNSNFYKVLVKIETGIKRMSEQAAAVRWYLEADDVETAYEKAIKLEAVTEKTTLLTRVLPAYTGNPNAAGLVEEIIAETIPVEMGFTAEGWFCLRMPTLLPKKQSGSTEYIRGYLVEAMKKFFAGKPRIRYRDCVLVFRHVYDKTRPEKLRRDHDNIEVNKVADIVAMHVLPDDNPSVCSHYYCSASASEERTEVYVVPKHDFPLWFVDEKAMPDKGVMLYENIISGA